MAEMMLISSRPHVSEPLDLWVDRIDMPCTEGARRVIEQDDGQVVAFFAYEGSCRPTGRV